MALGYQVSNCPALYIFPRSFSSNRIHFTASSSRTRFKRSSRNPGRICAYLRTGEEKFKKGVAENTLRLLEWPKVCDAVSAFADTDAGKQALQEQLFSLPSSLEESNYLLSETTAGIQMLDLFEGMFDFGGLQTSEVKTTIRKLRKGSVLDGKEALALASLMQFCSGLKSLEKTAVKKNAEWHGKLMPVSSKISTMVIDEQLVKEILRIVDEDGIVKDDASPELKNARFYAQNLEKKVYRLLDNILSKGRNDTGSEGIRCLNGRWCITSTQEQGDNQFQGLLLQNSSKTGNYVEPIAVVALNDEIAKAKIVISKAEHEVLKKLTKKVLPILDEVEHLFISILSLDVIMARAKYSREFEGAYPLLYLVDALDPSLSFETDLENSVTTESDSKEYKDEWLLYIRKLYHPLIFQHHRQKIIDLSRDKAVPIDVLIRRKTKVLIITGPNTGGKTVALKTVGLAVLMAKLGLYVLAEEPIHIPFFDCVLADIGDEQSLSQSLSTFSGHLKQIKAILSESTRHSLVLLDEVGAGTNPLEGAALGMSLLESFAERNCLLTIATTHQGEIKALKFSNNKCENACVEFDEVRLRPTYKLLWGIPGQSNALTIAERLGLPSYVVNEARRIYGKASAEINMVIIDLEKDKRALHGNVEETEYFLIKLKYLHQRLVAAKDQTTEYNNVHEHWKLHEIMQAATKARSSVHSILRSHRKSKHSLNPRSDSTKEKEEEDILPEAPLGPNPGKQELFPSIGQEVYIPSLGKKGKVISIKKKKNEIGIQSGGFKLTIKPDQWLQLDDQF